MGIYISKKIDENRAGIILKSFNKSIYNSVIDTIQECVGVGEITKDVLKTGKGKITKLAMQQEMVLIKECLEEDNFRNRLKAILYETIYKQINLINEVNYKNRILFLITHFDINKTMNNKSSITPLKLAVKNIRDLLKSSKELNNKTKEEISIIMKQGIVDVTDKIDIIDKMREELGKGGGYTNESFVINKYSADARFTIPIYIIVFIIVVLTIVYKIQSGVSLEIQNGRID